MGMVVMSKRELNRLDVLARLDSDRLTARAAAELMAGPHSTPQAVVLQCPFRDMITRIPPVLGLLRHSPVVF